MPVSNLEKESESNMQMDMEIEINDFLPKSLITGDPAMDLKLLDYLNLYDLPKLAILNKSMYLVVEAYAAFQNWRDLHRKNKENLPHNSALYEEMLFLQACELGMIALVQRFYHQSLAKQGLCISIRKGFYNVAEIIFDISKATGEAIDLEETRLCTLRTSQPTFLPWLKQLLQREEKKTDVIFDKFSINYLASTASIETAKWFLEEVKKEKRDSEKIIRKLFRGLYKSGNIDVLSWLFHYIQFEFVNSKNFLKELSEKSLKAPYFSKPDPFIWLYGTAKEEGISIDIHRRREKLFIRACKSNNLELAKSIYQIALEEGIPVDIHSNNDKAFRKAYHYDCLEICEYLFQLGQTASQPLDLHQLSEKILLHSTRKKRDLRMLRWIFEKSLLEGSRLRIGIQVLNVLFLEFVDYGEESIEDANFLFQMSQYQKPIDLIKELIVALSLEYVEKAIILFKIFKNSGKLIDISNIFIKFSKEYELTKARILAFIDFCEKVERKADIHSMIKTLLSDTEFHSLKILKLLYKMTIDNKCPFNLHMDDDWPLVISCMYGKIELVEWILEEGIWFCTNYQTRPINEAYYICAVMKSTGMTCWLEQFLHQNGLALVFFKNKFFEFKYAYDACKARGFEKEKQIIKEEALKYREMLIGLET